MPNCDCQIETKNKDQQAVLVALLSINALMFVAEIILGIIGDSTALIADSLDMLADATVYGIGLYAVGHSMLVKIRAARISGVFQVILGCMVIADVMRRFILGSEPESLIMMLVGLAALVANVICLKLISKYRDGEVHMRASWVFSKNDVIANLGIIIAGGLVYLLDSRLPDLVIGLLVSLLVIKGGVFIVRDASKEARA